MIAIKEQTNLVRYDAADHRSSYGVARQYDIYINGKYADSVETEDALPTALIYLRAAIAQRNATAQRIAAALERAKARISKNGGSNI